MKTLIIFYSYSGHTKTIAKELAAKEALDLLEIKDVKRPGVLKAYTAGCFAAMQGKGWPIQSLNVDFSKYEKLLLLAPIWANNPPPAFNSFLEAMPKGKTVGLKMISSSGKSKCKDRLKTLLKSKNCTLVSFEDIKA